MREPEMQPEEKILLKTRRHWAILLRDAVVALAIGAAPFILLGLLSLPGFLPLDNRMFLHALAFIEVLWLLLVWLALFVLWTNYYLGFWIVTDRRIVNAEQKNLFRRATTAWPLENVQEATAETRNPLQDFLNYGAVDLKIAGAPERHILIEDVPHPDEISSLVLKQIERYRKLEETTKKQETLLHTLSHEVKAHLTKGAAALAAIVEGDYGAVPENLKTMAGTALSETRKGVAMVMNMLSGANFKTGTMGLDSTQLDLSALARDVCESLKKDAEDKGLAIECAIAPGDYRLQGDATKLRDLVVRNLVDNAIRYTERGYVRVSLARSERAIILAVADSGIGISADDLQKLFTEGGKGAHSSEINPLSTGYGLSIAKRIIEAHGGVIWAESDGENRGSTFYVALPVPAEEVGRSAPPQKEV